MADGSIVIDTTIDQSGADSGLSTLRNKLEKQGESMKKVGSTLNKAVTLPLVGIATVGVATFTKFDDSMRKVEATMGTGLGKTTKEVEANTKALRDEAKKLGSETAFSASQAAAGMEKLALAGWDTTQILAATGPMLNLASAGGMELALAADIVTDTMAAFSMEADQAEKATDIFAKTSSSANTDVAQMGEAMKYAGASAAAAGMDLEQTSAVIGTLANAGIKGGSAGTVFNAMLRDMKKNAEDGKFAVGEHSVALYDQEGNMRDLTTVMSEVEKATDGMTTAQRDAALSAIFGEESIRGVNVMMAQGTDATKELEAALYDSAGTSQMMAEHMEGGLGGAFRSMMSALEGFSISIGEILAPAVQLVADKIAELALWFTNLSPKAQTLIMIIGGIAAALGPFLTVAGTLVIFVGKIAGVFAAATAAGTSVTAILAGMVAPVAIAIGVFAALIAIGVLLYKNWDTIKEHTIKAWNAIIAFLQPAIDVIKSTLMDRFNEIKEWWNELQDNLLSAFENIWNAITTTAETAMNALQAIFGWALPWLEMLFTSVWDTILGVIDGAINVIMGLIGVFAALFTGNWSMLWNNVKTVLQGALDIIISLFQGVWEAIGIIIVAAGAAIVKVVTLFMQDMWARIVAEWEIIKAFFSSAWDEVKEIFSAAIESIKQFFADLGASIMTVLQPYIDQWKEMFTAAWESIKGIFTAAMDWIKNIIAVVMGSEIVQEMMLTFEHWKAKFTEVWEAVKLIFTAAFTALKTYVTEWLAEKVELITTGFELVKLAISNAWLAIQTTVSNFLLVIKTFVVNWINEKLAIIQGVMGMISGVFSNVWGMIKTAVSAFLGGIKKDTDKKMNDSKTSVTNVLDTIKGVFSNIWNNIKTIVSVAINAIKSVISVIFNGIKTFFSAIWQTIKGIFVAAMMALRGDTEGAMNRIKQTITNVMNTIKNFFTTSWNTIKSTITNVLRGIVSVVTNGFNNVKRVITNGLNAAINIVTNMGTKFKNAGAKIISMLADGIKGAVGKVTGAIGDVVGKVRDFLPFSPAKVGPLDDIDHLNFHGPMVDSIKRGTKYVQGAMGEMLKMPEINHSLAVNGSYTAPNVAERINPIVNVPEQEMRIIAGDVVLNERAVGQAIWKEVEKHINKNNLIKNKFK